MENFVIYQRVSPFHLEKIGLGKSKKNSYKEGLQKMCLQLSDNSRERRWAVRN